MLLSGRINSRPNSDSHLISILSILFSLVLLDRSIFYPDSHLISSLSDFLLCCQEEAVPACVLAEAVQRGRRGRQPEVRWRGRGRRLAGA